VSTKLLSRKPSRPHIGPDGRVVQTATSRRIVVAVMLAMAALTAQAGGAAAWRPLPDPPATQSYGPLMVEFAIYELAHDYRQALLADKHRIHNEILLLINTGRAAL
jgi:hypothetical protein